MGESVGPDSIYTAGGSLTGLLHLHSTQQGALWEQKGSTEAGVLMTSIGAHHWLEGCYPSQPGSVQLQTLMADPFIRVVKHFQLRN